MKAKIRPRIEIEGRHRLEKLIPLSTPFTIYVDPSSACNFRCIFCPTGDRDLISNKQRFQGTMNFELYKKIIDDICEFERPLKVLRLYKDGEPLLNKNFPEMISYAKQRGCAEVIDTTTNGQLLTESLSKDIINAGIDKINISVNGVSDDQFLRFTKTKVNFNEYVDNIRFLYDHKKDCKICIKIAGDYLSEEDKQRFMNIFGEMSDRIFIENFAPCWPEFDTEARTGVKIEKGIYQNELTNVNVCPYIFYTIAVNSDGTVSLCFLDWARRLIIGDAKIQSIKAIWNGGDLLMHRIVHLSGRRREKHVCKSCGQLTHCMPDNIDEYSEDILERIINEKN